MDKETLKKMSRDPQNIMGIYNYCDYWCDRCPFTLRCLNYKMGQYDEKQQKLNESKTGHSEEENKAFWGNIHQNFVLAQDMLREDAKRFGIDIDNLPDMPEVELQEQNVHKFVNTHPLSKMAEAYSFGTMEWFKKFKNDNLQENLEAILQQKFLISGDEANVKTIAGQINDALEVIRWYQFQIPVKLKRALSGKAHDKIFGSDEDDDFNKDADGSAKVSLIGIDRSIGAWSIFLQTFSDYEDFVLETLASLERLRKGIENEFPHARAFIRPGFDR